MTVDEQRVRYVSGNDRCLVNVELIKRFNYMDATTTRRVGRFHDPNVPFWLRLPQLLIMSMEVMKLIGQDVSVRYEIKLRSTKSLLHLDIVETKSVFSGDLVALWEVVNALEFVQAFIQIAFAGAGRPEDVPLVRVCVVKIVSLQNRTDQLCITFEELVEHFAVIDVIAAARTLSRHRRVQ